MPVGVRIPAAVDVLAAPGGVFLRVGDDVNISACVGPLVVCGLALVGALAGVAQSLVPSGMRTMSVMFFALKAACKMD